MCVFPHMERGSTLLEAVKAFRLSLVKTRDMTDVKKVFILLT